MDENQTQIATSFEKREGSVLQKYYRQPKIYIELPSKGKYYAEGSLDISQDGKYAVYAMTAKDELMYKTPDALMSGQSTVEVIKSCIPSIIDPWQMPSLDLDACLVAIRIATYGEDMEVVAECPSCGTVNDYTIQLTNYLNQSAQFTYKDQIELDGLVINIRPLSYKEVTQAALKNIEQERIFSIVNDENMSDEEKIERFGASFVKLTELTVDMIAGCISRIDTPEGSESDPKMIRDFIANAPKGSFDVINKRLQEMKNELELKMFDAECVECHHKFNVNVTLDHSNFFEVGS